MSAKLACIFDGKGWITETFLPLFIKTLDEVRELTPPFTNFYEY
jgi:hypothetical protein